MKYAIAFGSLSLFLLAFTTNERAQLTQYSIQDEDLNKGKVIFETKCARCHKLKNPYEGRKARKGKKILNRMVMKADVNEDDKALLKTYLLSLIK